MSEALAVQDHTPALRSEMTVGELVAQVTLIQDAMKVAMKDGEHFGVIPGTDKPTLLKPGAEKLCLLFRLDPEYESTERWEGDHYTVTAICRLFHIPTGNRVASGQGLCSTKESKYAYRTAKRVCPACGAEQIIKGQAQYGGGWVCWKKKGGCGAKFSDGDQAIEGQEAGQKPNENLPDTYNTVLKMACKRALVAAVLNGTAASDIFTQDIDDSDESLASGPGTQTHGSDTPGSDASDPERKAAIAALDDAFKHATDHGSLPPGQADWASYLRDEIAARYGVTPEQWRTRLAPKQMLELAGWLAEQEIPL